MSTTGFFLSQDQAHLVLLQVNDIPWKTASLEIKYQANFHIYHLEVIWAVNIFLELHP